jgi:PhnB protein
MAINTVAHLNFRGDARQALEFYQSVFGGHTVIITYQDAYNVQKPEEANQIMWGQVTAENGFQIMAYDVPSSLAWDQGENAVFISVRGDNTEEISQYWAKLAENATIIQPLEPAQWSPLYGMLKDQFGVIWVLDVAVQYS